MEQYPDGKELPNLDVKTQKRVIIDLDYWDDMNAGSFLIVVVDPSNLKSVNRIDYMLPYKLCQGFFSSFVDGFISSSRDKVVSV